MDDSQFASFKPIESYENYNKRQIADYYRDNNIYPDNDFLSKYLEDLSRPIDFSTPTPTTNQSTGRSLQQIVDDIIAERKKSNPTDYSNENKSTGAKSKEIINFLMSNNFTKAQAAGIVGNLQKESGLNTTAVGDNGTSYGLAQWHNERKTALIQFAKQQGLDPNSVHGQMEYLMHELRTSHNETLQALLKAKTPREAARIFGTKFERPKVYDSSREDYADKAFNV